MLDPYTFLADPGVFGGNGSDSDDKANDADSRDNNGFVRYVKHIFFRDYFRITKTIF